MTGDGDSGNGADLRAENARLVALLVSHGIEWRKPAEADVLPAASALSTDQKVTLFRRLFAGRTDVYPVRWESKAGKTGYAPACANEWRAGVCEKPRIKCADCSHRSLIALSDRTIFDHLAGRHTTGVYPLLTNDTCNFLAVDFDDAEWRRSLAVSWACPWPWRSRAQVKAPTPGSSSRRALRRVTPVASARP